MHSVMDDIQYHGGGLFFCVGAVGALFGLSYDRSTNIMVWGLGFAVLAYMRMRLRADPKEPA
jgi:hypothetical protein